VAGKSKSSIPLSEPGVESQEERLQPGWALAAAAKVAHPAALEAMRIAELAQVRPWASEAPMLLATQASAELRALPVFGPWLRAARSCLLLVLSAAIPSTDEDSQHVCTRSDPTAEEPSPARCFLR